MTLTQFMIPIWKCMGFIMIVFIAYQWGSWNGYCEGVTVGRRL